MQIVIPMSGTGQRFVKAGYTDPKPLIKIEEKPIIQHVVERFPGESNFIFVCNADHMANTDMKKTLKSIAPSGRIKTIPAHKKGPVYAVSLVFDSIDDVEPVVVNYCDFSWRWNYADFQKKVRENECDGCVISYKNFHPHLLHPNCYASMREIRPNWMAEIREKHSFTPNKMDCYQSSGTYYFRTGAIMKECFQSLMDKNIALNGEFYVSLVYNELVLNNHSVFIYEIPFMLQWGTPEDFEEYAYWSDYFLGKKHYD